MFSELSKSAIVLAIFNILIYALALNPNCLKALSNIFLDSFDKIQYFLINSVDNSEFEKIPYF